MNKSLAQEIAEINSNLKIVSKKIDDLYLLVANIDPDLTKLDPEERLLVVEAFNNAKRIRAMRNKGERS